jgi:dihydroorotate dehydrogenase
LKFPNPVGLAAGFDKNAKFFDEMESCGFGFIEIGTVTPLAQPGNDLPRLFRLKKDEAILNRMGFNNDGVQEALKHLKARKNKKLIIGGNIGKNKWTPNEEALNDYVICFDALFDEVDYFVVNVSSPNTPNLRALQEKGPLMELLSTLQQKNEAKANPKPILLKIAPDLTNEQLDEIIEIVKITALDGIIATNTTISRDNLMSASTIISEVGGLSGRPLTKRSTEVIRYLRNKSDKNLVIIGVGGVFNSVDAKEKLEAGANLVQVYTGFIYEGPGMVKRILKDL